MTHEGPLVAGLRRMRLGWVTGLEPATFGATVRRSNQLSYTHRGVAGTPGGIRTPDLEIRSLPLYPTELRAHVRAPAGVPMMNGTCGATPCQSARGGAGNHHGAADGTRTRNNQLGRLMLYQLNYRRIWSGRPDSNRRPSAPKADALPNCATARPHSGEAQRAPLPESTAQYRDAGVREQIPAGGLSTAERGLQRSERSPPVADRVLLGER